MLRVTRLTPWFIIRLLEWRIDRKQDRCPHEHLSAPPVRPPHVWYEAEKRYGNVASLCLLCDDCGAAAPHDAKARRLAFSRPTST
jgi:hypothetical protein